MLEIVQIICYTEKTSPGTVVREALLTEGKAMEGDCHTNGVSILTEEAKVQADKLSGGLCIGKFRANLLVRSADRDFCGKPSAVLRVTKKKKCYEGCALFANGTECALAKGAFLAETERGGIVSTGDVIEVLTT